MDSELQGPASTMRASFARVVGGDAAAGALTPADEHFNLLSSWASSVGGQAGAAGPASQVLGELGVRVPPAWWGLERREAEAAEATAAASAAAAAEPPLPQPAESPPAPAVDDATRARLLAQLAEWA